MHALSRGAQQEPVGLVFSIKRADGTIVTEIAMDRATMISLFSECRLHAMDLTKHTIVLDVGPDALGVRSSSQRVNGKPVIHKAPDHFIDKTH